MIDESSHQCEHIAATISSLVKLPEAVIGFEALAGALYWSDEVPRLDDPDYTSWLRPILRYRTTVILGEPDQRYEDAWRQAKRLFPKWPGFASERCRPDSQLAVLYRKKSRASCLSFIGADIVYRLQQTFRTSLPFQAIEELALKRKWADIRIGELHDFVCRHMRQAGVEVPDDSWDRLRHSVAEATGAKQDAIARTTWLARLAFQRAPDANKS